MFDIANLLIKTIAAPVAKLLLKNLLNDTAVEFGNGVIDFLGEKTSSTLDIRDRRRIQRYIEELSDSTIEVLKPVFSSEQNKDLNLEAIVIQLGQALDQEQLSFVFVQANLEPKAALHAIRSFYPIKEKGLTAAEAEFYEMALQHIVPCMVKIANELPGFEIAHAKSTLEGLATLSRKIDEVLSTVNPIVQIADDMRVVVSDVKTRQKKEESDAKRYEQLYVDAVQRKLNYFDLIGIAAPEETEDLELSVSFIQLTVSYSGQQNSTPLLFNRLLDLLILRQSGLLIEGPAGSGKTTLLRWAAINAGQSARSISPALSRHRDQELATNDYSYSPTSWRDLIPFFIRLRDCKDGQLPSMSNFPQLFDNQLPSPPEGWVDQILAERRGLIIFDGADEVPPGFRLTMSRNLQHFILKHLDNAFILSTRPGVSQGWVRDLDFRRAEINPMSTLDVKQFVEQWHMTVQQVLQRRGSSRAEEVTALGEELMRHLHDEPAVMRLATNPLLCAAICALHYQRRGYLPNKQHSICELLCEMLLHQRDIVRRLPKDGLPLSYMTLGYDEKKRISQHIAYQMILNERSAISIMEAKELIREQLPKFDGIIAEDALIMTSTFVERSGLLRAYQEESVEFVHNTLKEYLAAGKFVEGLTDLLTEKALNFSVQDESTWHNVAVFASAIGSVQFALELIEKILTVVLSGADHRQRLVLALRCMAATTELSEALRDKQRGIERELFPPLDMTEALRLADVGDRVVRFLRFDPEISAGQLAACVRTLRLIGTEAAYSALRDYVGCRQKQVIDELVPVINPLEISDVIENLINGRRIPEGYRRYVCDLRLLTQWPDTKELDLLGTDVSDINALGELTQLQVLNLVDTNVHDVSALHKLVHLKKLSLSGTKVTEVERLGELTNLEWLDIADTNVSDISVLQNLDKLRVLDIRDTKVNDLSSLNKLVNLRIYK